MKSTWMTSPAFPKDAGDSFRVVTCQSETSRRRGTDMWGLPSRLHGSHIAFHRIIRDKIHCAHRDTTRLQFQRTKQRNFEKKIQVVWISRALSWPMYWKYSKSKFHIGSMQRPCRRGNQKSCRWTCWGKCHANMHVTCARGLLSCQCFVFFADCERIR